MSPSRLLDGPMLARVALLATVLLLFQGLGSLIPVSATSSTPGQAHLVWYTPQDTPWSDWIVLEGSGPVANHEETWGPTVRFQGDGDEPVIRSPSMEAWDRAVLWFMLEGDLNAVDDAPLFEILDDQGDPVMMVMVDDGGLEFWPWDPDDQAWDRVPHESIHSTPIISGTWNRLEIAPLDGEIRVSFGDRTVTLPNRSGDPTYLQASPADPVNGELDWSLGGLRVTQGAPVDEAFDSDAVDPRLVVEATDALAKAEVSPRQGADPDRGLIEVQGSPLPEGRAFAAAPVDGVSDRVLVETSFRVNSHFTWNQPTHHALLAGLRDDAGAPGEATWQLAFSPVWLEERRQDPTYAQDPIPDPSANGEPWGLYLHVQHKAPQRLATFDAVDLGTWHMLTVRMGEDGGTLWLDREPLGTYELWPQGWVAIGDVEGHGAPVVDRTGGGINAIAHSGLFVASAGPTEVDGELLWYTPYDTPWSDWTLEAGSPATIVEESWGPTLALGSGTDDPALVSPDLGDWDHLVTWFSVEDADGADNALLYQALDAQGEVLFQVGVEAGIIEAWYPDTPTPIDRLPAHPLSRGGWHQLTFIAQQDGVEVRLGDGVMDIPLDPDDEIRALGVGSTGDDSTTWELRGLRVTQGPVLEETFARSTLDPRLTLERPEHDGYVEHQPGSGALPSLGSLQVQGSWLPDGRALVAAPVDLGQGPLFVETTFRVPQTMTSHHPDHQAVIGGLQDKDGAPGVPVWAVTLSPVWQEERRSDPTHTDDPVPDLRPGGEPLGLYLVTGDGDPVLVATLDEREERLLDQPPWPTWHVLTARLDPATGALALSLDREPLAGDTVDLSGTGWIGTGDLYDDGLPLVTRTGGTSLPTLSLAPGPVGAVDHGHLFIAGMGVD